MLTGALGAHQRVLPEMPYAYSRQMLFAALPTELRKIRRCSAERGVAGGIVREMS